MPARNLTLDGLRGLAIALVLAFHFLGGTVTPDGPWTSLVHTLGMLGWIGVDLFFVLSGFLITRLLLASRGAPGYFSRFYARRVLRIFPLYYAVVLGLAATVGVGWTLPWQLAYLGNVPAVMLQAHPASLGITWTLAIEEQFYVAWPLIVALVPVRRLPSVCVAAAIIAPTLRLGLVLSGHRPLATLLVFARMDALALGALLACGRTLPALVARAARVVLVALLGVGATFVGLPGLGGALTITIGLSALAVAFASSLADAMADRGFFALVGRVRVLQWLGMRAYGVYLLQAPVQMVLGQWHPTALIEAIVGPLLTVGVAAISWRYFEVPINRLKRFVPYGRAENVTAARDSTPHIIERERRRDRLLIEP